MTTSINGLVQIVPSEVLIYLLQSPRRGTGQSRGGEGEIACQEGSISISHVIALNTVKCMALHRDTVV